MITKIVVKDYVQKRCPYLVFLELEDNRLVDLLKRYVELQDTYKELVDDAKEDGADTSDTFDLLETLREYPYLAEDIKKIQKKTAKNLVDELVEKYVDDQLISKLSRRYFEIHYGKENCKECDLDDAGMRYVDQYAIEQQTKKALADPNIKIIFEGQLIHDNLRARFDVLIRNDDGSFDLIEVKGTNSIFNHPEHKKIKDYSVDSSIKDKYLYDLLFQYYVYKKAGLNIKHVGYMFTNREYQLKNLTYPVSDKELDDLFILKSFINLPEKTISLKEYFDNEKYLFNNKGKVIKESIDEIVDKINQIARLKEVKAEKKYECCKGPICPFIESCFKGALDPNSIFKLTRWGSYGGDYHKTLHYLDNGVHNISDIDLSDGRYLMFKNNGQRSNAYSQIRYQKGEIKEKYLIEKSTVKDILLKDYMNDKIDYLLFFDFESFQYPIPLVQYLTPWKQVVSQYSMHIVKKGYDLAKHDFAKGRGGDVFHYEYIANPDKTGFANPSIELYKTLKKQLEEVGIDPYASNYRVVVFNKSFEKTRMTEFVNDFMDKVDKDLTDFVANFNNNVVDLLDFFTSGGIYCRDFNGRGSLKVVQPTLRDDKDVQTFYKNLPFDFVYSLDYHKDDTCLVYNGAICLDLYKALLVRSHLGQQNKGPSTERLLDEALAYCKIDSWGTVIIYDVIKNIYLGNLKVDALFV